MQLPAISLPSFHSSSFHSSANQGLGIQGVQEHSEFSGVRAHACISGKNERSTKTHNKDRTLRASATTINHRVLMVRTKATSRTMNEADMRSPHAARKNDMSLRAKEYSGRNNVFPTWERTLPSERRKSPNLFSPNILPIIQSST